MEKVSIQTLLEAGAHFGHQTRRWNPKMKPYIFGSRGDIYIIDLVKSLEGMDNAYSFVSELAAKGGTVLFVGTKKQAQEAIADAANSCGMPYVNARWLGGMLTNFATIRTRVQRMEELEAMDADGRMAVLPKKEQILLRKELVKLQTNLNGIRNMKKTPDAVFVIDTNKEAIAIQEAKKLGIPVVGTLDTNCDPDDVEYGIPANDDAIRTVKLLSEFVAHAVQTAMGAPITAAEMAGGAAPAAPAAPAAEVAEEAALVEAAEEAAPVEAAVEEAPEAVEAVAEEAAAEAEETATEEAAEASEEAAE
ncbi:MAG: 30S ribosomal protein S2 [Eggerthellaceae bacterium]|nr:30S ribosomal protein S2 [Eggerthellaceae bacterium]